MEKLAVFGGRPVRKEKIFYGRQWIDENDIAAVTKVLRSDFLTGGPEVGVFEKKLCDYVESKYAVAVSSGTAALHCACMAAGIEPGDEVIVSAITFMPSANCVLYCGATPVFADLDPETFNIDPESIRKCITPKTKAIIAVDLGGQPVNIREIRKICDEFNLIFIEDAAHSLGSSYDGKKVGTLADMTCMSFHPVKTITSAEGGAVTTNNREYYDRLLLVHNHGMTKNKELMIENADEGPWRVEQQMLGYNYRLSDVQCALLTSQMNRLDYFVTRRKELAARYDGAFSGIKELSVQKQIDEADTCCHIYLIRLNERYLSCTRREFYDAMSAENVQCHVQYLPVYLHPYYKKLGYKPGLCPIAEDIYEGILTIPLYPKMTNQDADDVIHAIKKVVEYYRK